MLDSYKKLFDKGLITKEKLFDFGLSETIYVDLDTAEHEWEKLKDKILYEEKVFIRGFGKNARGSHLFTKFYTNLLGNKNISIDSTNNAEPTKMLKEWTGYSKNGGINFKHIRNYQVAHVFGRTKNVYCFTAPWNTVYLPKIIDPFTGHEAKGTYVDEYTALFQKSTYDKFKPLIDDFNSIITDKEFISNIKTTLDLMNDDKNISSKDIEKLKTSIHNEFMPIEI